MSRRRVEDRKKLITLRMKGSVVDRLRRVKGYNILVERLLEKYFKDVDR